MYKFLKTAYRLGRITAAEVWAAADAKKITPAEAAAICGARPR